MAAPKAPLFNAIASALEGCLITCPGVSYAATSLQIAQLHQSSYAFWDAYTTSLVPCCLPTDVDAVGLPHQQSRKNVPIPTLEGLKSVYASEGLTLGNTFMAAWPIMLAIRTGSATVCFNNISAGRDQPVEGKGWCASCIHMLPTPGHQ